MLISDSYPRVNTSRYDAANVDPNNLLSVFSISRGIRSKFARIEQKSCFIVLFELADGCYTEIYGSFSSKTTIELMEWFTMSAGFDPIPFNGSPILWNNRHRTTSPGISFYHWHQCCELLLVCGGSGTVVLNNQTYPIFEGMLFVFQPYEIHKVFAKATEGLPYDRVVVHLNHVHIGPYLQSFPKRQELFDRLCYSPDMERVFVLGEQFEAVRQCMEDYERFAHDDRGATQEEITVLLLRLLSLLEKVIPETRSPSPVQWRSKEYSERIMSWIEANYMENDILNKLAGELHLTRSYISRLFKKETGSNLSEYLTTKRIKVAVHLLESTSTPVESIAHQIGFQNVSHFISCFKKTYQLTPLRYRIKVKTTDYS